MTLSIYAAFIVWAIVSSYLIFLALKRERLNLYLYRSIPNVFTTIGVLGTFIGIYIGLQDFDTSNITESIPPLLEGLKTAFATSILGIISSIVFGRISEGVLGYAESKKEAVPTDEMTLFSNVLYELKRLNTAVRSEEDQSLSEQLLNLRTELIDVNKGLSSQKDQLDTMVKALGSDSESSLLTQLKKLRVQQDESFAIDKKLLETTTLMQDEQVSFQKENKEAQQKFIEKTDGVLEKMDNNGKLLETKFDEFAELLAKNNTEALVEVMKAATEEFNSQMSALINKLVQENFQELNNSVKQLNTWQIENKEMIGDLTEKHRATVEEFKVAASSIEAFTKSSGEIVENTKLLTDDNSDLVKLINILKEVIIEDERFKDVAEMLLANVEKVQENINAFDKTTNRLNDWVDKEKGVKDAVQELIFKLEEVAQIRAYNGEFWNETKQQLNEGVGLISQSTDAISSNLNGINREFQSQLNETLTSLDELIQRIMMKYRSN